MPTHDSRAPFATSLRTLTALALPIAGVQVGMMLMGVVETVICGHVSPVALAAVALGHLYLFCVLVFGMGVLSTLDALVSQGLGAGDESQVTLAVQRGVLLALVMSVVATLLYLPAEQVFRALGQPEEVVPAAGAFIRYSIAGALPLLLFFAFRLTLQAMHHTRPAVVTIIAANVINAVVCGALTLGWFGLPRLGVVGAAWAGTIARWTMAAMLLWLGRRELMPRLRPWRRESTDRAALGRMLALGAPIGATASMEFGMFGGAALLMGRFGTVAVAAHQVAISIASFTFMVPAGIAGAASVLVGRAVGRDDLPGARHAAGAALVLGLGWMVVTSLLFFTIPGPLASVYTPDHAVLALASVLLVVGGFFQIFDCTQVIAMGILRGLGDTRAPMWITVLGYMMVGLPVGVLLGFRFGLGPVGLWWGLVAGLAAVSVMLVWRIRSRLTRALQRVRIDAVGVAGAE